MNGKILPSLEETIQKRVRKELVSAVKDIRNGVKLEELKKKYSDETIMSAYDIERICKS